MKTSEVLIKAKEVLLERGWGKGLGLHPKVCAGTAIDKVLGFRQDGKDAYDYLAEVINEEKRNDSIRVIIDYNDDPDTSLEMILYKFDEAYELARKEEQDENDTE